MGCGRSLVRPKIGRPGGEQFAPSSGARSRRAGPVDNPARPGGQRRCPIPAKDNP